MPITTIHSSGQIPGQQTGNRADSQSEARSSGRVQQGVGTAPQAGESSVAERRQKALQTVEDTLAMGYRKLAEQRPGAGAFAQAEPLTSEKVAGTILGFIERRLQMDAAEGATAEQLEARLEEGLRGFRKGFAEAQKQLEALAAFTPEIRADIAETRDLVLSGVEDLRQQIIDGQLSAPVDERGKPTGEAAPLMYVYEQARASRFDFELTTAEGDVVRIEANRSSAASVSGTGRSESLSAAVSESLRWSVSGDLNKDERAAIESLLGDVDKLAQQFFSGNLEGAMASARALGYDDEQVAGFSLNLSRSEIRRATEVYGQMAPGRALGRAPESTAGPDLLTQLEPLGQFLKGMENALEKAREVSARPEALLTQLGAHMAAGDEAAYPTKAETLQDFMARMLDQLTTGPSTS